MGAVKQIEKNETLRELVTQAANIELMLLENGGLLTPEIEEKLAVLDVATPAKIDNYYNLMERFDAMQAVFKKKADDMAAIAKSFENANERLRFNLKEAMGIAEMDELRGNDYRFCLADSPPSVLIENSTEIPTDYKQTIISEKIDKKRIAEDLKLGVPVPGCSLTRGKTLRKYLAGAK